MRRLVHGHFPNQEEENSDTLKDNSDNLDFANKYCYMKKQKTKNKKEDKGMHFVDI